MCGQVGLILGRKRRRANELEYLRELFTYLLLRSEVRGPHATGVGWLKRDGSHKLFKQPVPAHVFADLNGYEEVLSGIDSQCTLVLGHTRWRTRGNEFNNRNNHPIRARDVLGTHNGTIYNAEALFKKYGLPRFSEVDSELIFRLADRCGAEGPIDQEALLAQLRPCRGQISAVLASQRDPGTTLVLKGNKPLSLRFHRQYRVVVYASEVQSLDDALAGESGWQPLELSPMSLLTLRHDDLSQTNFKPLGFHTEDPPQPQSNGEKP